MLLLWFTLSVIVCLHVRLGEIFILDSCFAIFWEEKIVPLAFYLKCSDCGAVTLNASFFPFGVLEQRV